MEKEKVIVFTGSFNPPTRAHLKALEEAMDRTDAVKGYLTPVSHNYIEQKMAKKGDNMVIPDNKRMEMLLAMAAEDSRIEVSDFEISGRGDSTRTYDTICEIGRLEPGKDVCMLAGADKLKSLHRWYNKDEFLQKFKVVVFCRDDLDPVSIIEKDPFLSGYRDSFIVLDKISEDAELSEISATKVRNLFRKGDPAYKNYLTDAVAHIMDTMSPEDFPELTFEGWVQVMRNSPSRHAAQMIYKRVYEENRKIIPGMEDIAERIAKAVVYARPVTADSVKSYGVTKVICENIDILDLARRQKAEGHDPAVVSTACGTDAAGFYASGDMMSKLSENEFCRRSDLSAYLYQFGNPRKRAVKESGVERRECAYPLSKEYGAVYSPGVRFFRENLKENYTLSKTPFSLSVVSAAPLSFLNNGDGLLYRTPEEGLSEEGKEVMFRKFLNIFSIAAVNGHDSVVMDDFGVRSTRLPQEDVAECLYRALSDPRVKGKLRLISIALSEGPRSPAYDYRERSKYSAYYKMADRLGEGG